MFRRPLRVVRKPNTSTGRGGDRMFRRPVKIKIETLTKYIDVLVGDRRRGTMEIPQLTEMLSIARHWRSSPTRTRSVDHATSPILGGANYKSPANSFEGTRIVSMGTATLLT